MDGYFIRDYLRGAVEFNNLWVAAWLAACLRCFLGRVNPSSITSVSRGYSTNNLAASTPEFSPPIEAMPFILKLFTLRLWSLLDYFLSLSTGC